MKVNKAIIGVIFFCIFSCGHGNAQTISKDELIFLTSQWKGERFADGRPKIPDDLLIRARNIGLDDAWTVLKNFGYLNQFEGGWKMVNDSTPVIGRAVTAMYLPSRPDVEKNIKERGLKEGRKGSTNAWLIDMLTKGDVYVADGFGKIAGGTLIGSTLGNSIYSKSGNGVVFNGSARDLAGLSEIKGFNAFVRDFHPSFLEGMVLMGLNTPIRIGNAIVLPGDLVIAGREGVLFIPAQLADQVITTSEFVTLKDKFGFEMVKTNKYSTGQIDSQWTDDIKQIFLKWLSQHPELGKMNKEKLEEIMSKRTW
ncbi:RraA family protein [Ferruginibacter sp.]|uniref:RraA family protein n=2 Tax=Ferruginibacter sp. TaxID=1940288 RepID=UPI0019BCF353|nr:RraA family protein [Ferruginibacter sp.]MBC7627218.1 RraA family protein [Ferruginibacter sp.]